MKILHLISGGDTGGAKTHVLNLLGELNSSEDVRLLCLREGVMSREARERGIPCTVLSGGFLTQLRAVKNAVREGDFALLHCHGSRANLTGALLKARLSVPVISTVHSDPRLDYLRRPAAAALFGTANRLALRRMDALVAVSESMKEALIRRGIPGSRIYTLYNGPDFRQPPRRTDRREWLSGQGISPSEDDVFIGCAARLDAVKDLPTLLRGFASACEENPRLRLLLAGTGSEQERLRRLCREKKVTDRVHFLGWVTDMAGFYSAVDINALSSLSETFPYSLTEGARYGIPAVATAVGGIPELMEDGKTGFLLSPGDSDGFARAFLTLSRDKALRETMGAALREKARTSFSLEAMGQRQREIYRAVALSRRGILLAGACGMGNPGDEAMLTAILARLRRSADGASITVLTHDPEATARRCGVNTLSVYDCPGILRAMKRARLLICGGGNLLQNVTSRRSLTYYLTLLRMGRRLGCRVILFGCGLGPLSPGGWRQTTRCLNRCVSVLVFREGDSLREAKEHGVSVPEMILSADPALAFPVGESSPREGDKALLLCLCPRPGRKRQARLLVNSARVWAEKRGWRLFLLPFAGSDTAFTARIAGRVPVLPSPGTPEEAADILRKSDAVLSSRLHALVLAYALGIPAAGVACDGRIRSFMGEHGLPWEDYGSVTGETAEKLLSAALQSPSPGLPAEDGERLERGFAILDREVQPRGSETL